MIRQTDWTNTTRRQQAKLRNKHRWWVRNNKHPEHKSKRGGYVYIMALGFDEIYKIGHAVDVGSRFENLKASNPRLAIFHIARVANMSRAETTLHKMFSSSKIERECFKMSEYDLQRAMKYLETEFPKIAPEGTIWAKP